MANKNIHGFDIEYNEESDTAKLYLDHLEYRLSHEEVRAFIEDAKNSTLRKIHLEDSHGNRVTLEYLGNDKCLIRKRQS
jgi:hypothetical protein